MTEISLNEMTEVVKQAKDEIIKLREINADLLEALELLENFVTESVATSDDLHEVVIARKAIRKAEGQMR